jgi:hypothetical protein
MSSTWRTRLVPCQDHRYKRWVFASAIVVGDTTEQQLRAIPVNNGFADFPFFVGRRGDVPEVVLMAQYGDRVKHQLKALKFERVCCFTVERGGGQSERIVKTLLQMQSTCTRYLSSMTYRSSTTEAETDHVRGSRRGGVDLGRLQVHRIR